MVVILCGCDGTGKSTCFSKLRESVEANFIKESYIKNETTRLLRALFTATKVEDDDLTIYDRATVLDDLVYQKVIANEESMLPLLAGFSSIQNTLKKSLIIYFDLDDSVLTERLMSRGDDYVTVHQINKIKKCYNDIFTVYGIKPVRLDTTDLSEEEVYNKVKEVINSEKSKSR